MSCWDYCYKFGYLDTSRVHDTSALTLAETVANIIIKGKELHLSRTANIQFFSFAFR